MIGVVVKQPNDAEFELIKTHVKEFWLDDTNMQKEQFLILLVDGKFTAFGRLRTSTDATELCTLGVVKEMQGKGYGRAMVKALVEAAKGDVHAVCVIPDFFVKLGFKEVKEYPQLIKDKVDLCVNHYHVNEPYVVMLWKKS